METDQLGSYGAAIRGFSSPVNVDLQRLALPRRPVGTWPDWGDLARTARLSFAPEVRRQPLQLDLQALNTFWHALLAPII
jgi:hypothetical protein